jgi:epoxide hydrolase-like predicted phosphatase
MSRRRVGSMGIGCSLPYDPRPMSRSFDAILYDFGGVFTGSPFATIGDAAARYGVTPEQLKEIVFGPYHADTDHPWHRLERGEMTFGDARDALIAHAADHGLDVDPFSLLGKGHDDGVDHAIVMVTHLRELRAEGYRTAIVTNNLREFRPHWEKMIPVDELFDDIVDSSFEGVRKPDARIYHLALERVGAVAERTVFLDDFPANVEAAKALGMAGVVVTDDRHAAVAELDAILGR